MVMAEVNPTVPKFDDETWMLIACIILVVIIAFLV
jgi:hypothetical protein